MSNNYWFSLCVSRSIIRVELGFEERPEMLLLSDFIQLLNLDRCELECSCAKVIRESLFLALKMC